MQFPEHGTQEKNCHLRHQPLKAFWWSFGNGEMDPKSSSQIFHDSVITSIFFGFLLTDPTKREPQIQKEVSNRLHGCRAHTTTSTKCESFWGLLNRVRLFSPYKIVYPNGGHSLALHYTGAPFWRLQKSCEVFTEDSIGVLLTHSQRAYKLKASTLQRPRQTNMASRGPCLQRAAEGAGVPSTGAT